MEQWLSWNYFRFLRIFSNNFPLFPFKGVFGLTYWMFLSFHSQLHQHRIWGGKDRATPTTAATNWLESLLDSVNRLYWQFCEWNTNSYVMLLARAQSVPAVTDCSPCCTAITACTCTSIFVRHESKFLSIQLHLKNSLPPTTHNISNFTPRSLPDQPSVQAATAADLHRGRWSSPRPPTTHHLITIIIIVVVIRPKLYTGTKRFGNQL